MRPLSQLYRLLMPTLTAHYHYRIWSSLGYGD